MGKQSRMLWSAAAGGVVIMGLAGWWIGTLGSPRPPAPAPTDTENAAETATAPAPIIADLKKEWSNSNNPNPQPAGTWSYNAGTIPLAKINHWASGPVSGWGPPANAGGNFLPFFFQAPNDGVPNDPFGTDFKAGDIVIHAYDPSNGARNDEAAISWKSNTAGTATAIGSLWPIRNIDRTNTWQLVLHSDAPPKTLATGTLPEDGILSRDHPSNFTTPPFTLHKGDTLDLIITRALNSIGDFAAVNLTITTTPEATAAAPPSHPATPAPPAAPHSPAEGSISYGLLALIVALAALGVAILALGGVLLLLLRPSTKK